MRDVTAQMPNDFHVWGVGLDDINKAYAEWLRIKELEAQLTEANRRGEELIKYGNNLMQSMVGGGKQARAEELFFEALVEATATSKRGGE